MGIVHALVDVLAPRLVAKWEYLSFGHVFVHYGELRDEMDRLGDDGWELVNVDTRAHKSGRSISTLTFKRRKRWWREIATRCKDV